MPCYQGNHSLKVYRVLYNLSSNYIVSRLFHILSDLKLTGFTIIKNQLCNILLASRRFKYIGCMSLLYMRLELNIYNLNNSILEYNYNEALRKVILLYLAKTDNNLAKLFHDDPHYIFSFSSILGHSHSNKYGIFIKRGVLFVSSPNKDFIFTLLKSFLKFPIFKIGLRNNNKFAVSNMRILDNLNYDSPVKLMTLSPIILKRDNKYIAISGDSNEDDVNLWIDTLEYSVKCKCQVKNIQNRQMNIYHLYLNLSL
jgi:CRISPR/Cas system endoribonuclease Cas6 (RAMP superfamily)